MQLDVVSVVKQLIQDGRYTAALAECDKGLEGEPSKEVRLSLLQAKARLHVATDGKWTGPAIECLREALKLSAPGTDERGQVFAALTAGWAGLSCLGPCQRVGK